MEFPIYQTTAAVAPVKMLAALGLTEVINTSFSEKNKIIILEISSANLLANLKPDFNALLNSYENINGVLVTAPSSDEEYDFHYRIFLALGWNQRRSGDGRSANFSG